MNNYERSTNFLQALPGMNEWHEVLSLYRRIAAVRPRHWQLPIQACESIGANAEQAIPAMVATACSHISIILVDDMLDDDPRGEYHRIGMGAAANMACAFQSAGLAAIAHAQIEPGVKTRAMNSLNQMILTTALGQAWDAHCPVDESAYWRIVQTKSAPFFGTAMQIGAWLGGASEELADRFYKIGSLYGEMVQIHDDMGDVLAIPANPDWTQQRSPLPILFARSVDHPERERFLELCRNISDEFALQEAQAILVRCGALSYCVDRLLHRYRTAQELLDGMSLARREVMEALLEELVTPIWLLLQSVDRPLQPEFIMS